MRLFNKKGATLGPLFDTLTYKQERGVTLDSLKRSS